MVHTDWDRILSVNASSLTDEEIEDLFPAVVQCDVDEITDVHNLRTLMRLSQEIMTYKDNQVKEINYYVFIFKDIFKDVFFYI